MRFRVKPGNDGLAVRNDAENRPGMTLESEGISNPETHVPCAVADNVIYQRAAPRPVMRGGDTPGASPMSYNALKNSILTFHTPPKSGVV